MFSIAAECSKCGENFPFDEILTVCARCGGALLFRYDLGRIAEKVSKNVLKKREAPRAHACPEAASTLVALDKIEKEGVFDPDEKVLLNLTGDAIKYFDVIEIRKSEIPVLNRKAIHRFKSLENINA